MKYATNSIYKFISVFLGVALTSCGSGGSNSPLAPLQAACTDMTTSFVALPSVVITSATQLPAYVDANPSRSYPKLCLIKGQVNQRVGIDSNNYAIGFELRLPVENWNSKFMYSGEGGLGGDISFLDYLGRKGWDGTTNSLQKGFAVVVSDSGHQGSPSDSSFGFDFLARKDYAYSAIGVLTPAAKSIVQKFYAVAPTRSYYSGGSKGGQTGLMAASRFAHEYDGILVGQPAMDLHKAAVAAVYHTQQLASLDPTIVNAFTSQDLKFLAKKILHQCDGLDGAIDQMINDSNACQQYFNLSTDVTQCPSSFTPDGTCLSAAQISVVANLFNHLQDINGITIYKGWLWDPGIIGVDWMHSKSSTNVRLSAALVANIISVPPKPPITSLASAFTFNQTFDINTSLTIFNATSSAYTESAEQLFSMPNPTDFSVLKTKGKLIVHHGTADPIFSAKYTRNWYEALRSIDPQAENYVRLFLVPGMNHGGGGPATDKFDALSPLINWVENGVPPESILAGIDPDNVDKPSSWSINRTRPLCPYPKRALLISGATDFESASSFACN